jgi:hypothetical protein
LSYTENPFETRATTYDYDLNKLGEATFDAGATAKYEELSALLAGKPSTLVDGEESIVVCETNIGGAMDTPFSAAAFLGPHRGSFGSDNTSLFGWVSSSKNDVHGYLDGVLSTRFSLPAFDEFNISHARQVIGLALSDSFSGDTWPGLRLIPISAETCVFAPSVLQEIAARPDSSQIRIVSLSATLPIDHAACSELFPSGADTHFLWVTASGNAGRVFSDINSSFGCPQSVSQRSNLLVIDGADGDEVMELADQGPLYSDIAADCRNESGNCTGTSLSAPRVAHAAARIVQRHGNAISNPMVRSAILLSAYIPANPFNNRSGGILDLSSSLTMANMIVESGLGERNSMEVTEAQSLLEELYSEDLELVDFKLSTLKNNGFFDE